MKLKCLQCDEPLVRKPGPGRPPTKYCSVPCKDEFRKKGPRFCSKCPAKIARGVLCRGCRDAERPTHEDRTCQQCGEGFLHPRQPGHRPKYCSRRCADEAYNARRDADGRYAAMKAKQRGPGAACLECRAPLRTGALRCQPCNGDRPYIPEARRLAVYERDGWECQLCDLPVDPEARFPDPYCATLDHVMPYSRGGSDEEDNLQLAHFVCNCRKQDRVLAA